MLEPIDRDKYEVSITYSGNGNYKIDITEKYKVCDSCKKPRYYKSLYVRQDSRVKFLLVHKYFCRQCIIQVDLILKNIKPSVESVIDSGRY